MRRGFPTRPSSLSHVNHNVLFTFLYKFSDGIAQGVWSAASMATYIYILENKSTKVRPAFSMAEKCTASDRPLDILTSICSMLAWPKEFKGLVWHYLQFQASVTGCLTDSKPSFPDVLSFLRYATECHSSVVLQLDGWLIDSEGTGCCDSAHWLHAVSM